MKSYNKKSVKDIYIVGIDRDRRYDNLRLSSELTLQRPQTVQETLMTTGNDTCPTNCPSQACGRAGVGQPLGCCQSGNFVISSVDFKAYCTDLPEKTACNIDGMCASERCARIAGISGKVCCPTSNIAIYAENDYCADLSGGTQCFSDTMCQSGNCVGNQGGLTIGTCQSSTNAVDPDVCANTDENVKLVYKILSYVRRIYNGYDGSLSSLNTQNILITRDLENIEVDTLNKMQTFVQTCILPKLGPTTLDFIIYSNFNNDITAALRGL